MRCPRTAVSWRNQQRRTSSFLLLSPWALAKCVVTSASAPGESDCVGGLEDQAGGAPFETLASFFTACPSRFSRRGTSQASLGCGERCCRTRQGMGVRPRGFGYYATARPKIKIKVEKFWRQKNKNNNEMIAPASERGDKRVWCGSRRYVYVCVHARRCLMLELELEYGCECGCGCAQGAVWFRRGGTSRCRRGQVRTSDRPDLQTSTHTHRNNRASFFFL